MMQAMIFAAGLGTRLKPITDHMPKALVEVGGEPLLKRVIFRLKDAGTQRIVVNVHHFAGQIVDYLNANGNFGIDIRISDESDQLLETGGGIRKARLMFDSRYPVLIHNVDILSNVDLAKFYGYDRKVVCPDCGVPHVFAGATLLVSRRKTKRYLLFNAQMMLVGWVNIETGEIKSPYAEVKAMEEKISTLQPESRFAVLEAHFQLYAFSGIHTFSPFLFPMMESYPERFPIMDFYLQNCRRASIVGVVKDDLRLMDVGKQDTLAEAEKFLATL